MDRFKCMLLEISENLSTDDVGKLKFLCGNKIGKKKSEEISSGIQLFEFLIERTELGPGNTEVIRDLLNRIGREALVELVDRFEGQPISTDVPDPAEQEKINLATELIVEQLGKKWLQYGRKLGMSEGKLDAIQENHPRSLEERVRELFKQWQRMRKAEAKVDELIRALRACSLNYTADIVEQQLLNAGK